MRIVLAQRKDVNDNYPFVLNFDKFILVSKITKIDDRPYVVDSGLMAFKYLQNPIHEWFLEHHADYSIGFSMFKGMYVAREWYIDIPDPTIAVLFKLTWM